MIAEDYCSYEVAKLLKEKGFNEPVTELNRLLCKEGEKPVLRITHQKAMKWLREEYEIDIIPIIRHSLKYTQESPFRDYACRVYDCDGNIVLSATKWYSRYENAVEAALKYCLENLI